ncbi:MAG: hypothetical protein KBE65_00345 [Phycisphaerae bacterium]|nr:hypothetical protein [Phycisphaerae bacterium]
MGRYLSSAATASILILVGCFGFSCCGPKVRPEPVNFDHPDEVVRGKGFMALADRREFAVMAFLNATGFDEEAPGQQMHPVRVKVRQMVAANLAEHPKKVRAWRRYRNGLVREHLGTYGYQDYVLSLSTDYPFRRICRNDELGYWYTAWLLADLPKILNDFWKTAKLDEVWDAVKADYIAEIKRYDFEKMQREMTFLWKYLHMERQDTFTLVHVPNPLDRHFSAIGAGYDDCYYAVESPGAIAHSLNIHEYLHSIVNDLVGKNYAGHKSKLLEYYRAGKNAPGVASYREPVIFVSECMVRALDRRIRGQFENTARWANLTKSQVASDTKNGLNLTQPFYDLLDEFEQSAAPFDQYLPTMLERLPDFSGSMVAGQTVETGS